MLANSEFATTTNNTNKQQQQQQQHQRHLSSRTGWNRLAGTDRGKPLRAPIAAWRVHECV
eukprot:2158243-Alexandrium_andersonii.AAC.1